MSDLEKYLSADRVALGADVADRAGVLDRLARLLGGQDEATYEAIRDDLGRREVLGSTGVGGGIAFPHARVAPLPGLRLAVLRTAKPVEYAALDGQGLAGRELLGLGLIAAGVLLSLLARGQRVHGQYATA